MRKIGLVALTPAERTRRWRKNYPEKAKESKRRNYFKHREHYAAYKRRIKGIPEANRPKPEFCENCAERPAAIRDHDHTTGKFRGWLCNQCNLGLGQLGDSVAALIKALDYLRRNS